MADTWRMQLQTDLHTDEAYFHLLDLLIQTSCILLMFGGSKLSHRNTRLPLIRDLIEGDHPKWTIPSTTDSTWHTTQWILSLKRKTYVVSNVSSNKQRKWDSSNVQYNVGLRGAPCFKLYQIKLHCISEDCPTLNWKKQNTETVVPRPLPLLYQYFLITTGWNYKVNGA
jgi:hypothetical protein